jgi:hypothetical protein
MATNQYLSNPVVTVNTVALTGFCTAASVNVRFDALDNTTFGQTDRTYSKGLGDHECTLTLLLTYASAETYATLAPLVGTTTTVIVKPTSAVDSATNPGFTLTGTFLAELPVINATLGELQTIDITFQGGVYSADTTNP